MFQPIRFGRIAIAPALPRCCAVRVPVVATRRLFSASASGGMRQPNRSTPAATGRPASPAAPKYNVSELFDTAPKPKPKADAATSDADSGAAGDGDTSYRARWSRFTRSAFVRTGLPLILFVLGGSYGLSYMTVQRFESSANRRAGVDAAARGAAKDMHTTSAAAPTAADTPRSPKLKPATAAATAASASPTATAATATGSAAEAVIAPGSRVRADGSESARIVERHLPAAAAAENDMEAELAKLRRELNWAGGYENKRVARPKGQEADYLTGAYRPPAAPAAANKS